MTKVLHNSKAGWEGYLAHPVTKVEFDNGLTASFFWEDERPGYIEFAVFVNDKHKDYDRFGTRTYDSDPHLTYSEKNPWDWSQVFPMQALRILLPLVAHEHWDSKEAIDKQWHYEIDVAKNRIRMEL